MALIWSKPTEKDDEEERFGLQGRRIRYASERYKTGNAESKSDLGVCGACSGGLYPCDLVLLFVLAYRQLGL
jgi:hypothetical protein